MKQVVQVYAIRHQHAGIIATRLYQVPPDEAVVKEVTKRFGAGWSMVVPVELEVETGLSFEPVPVQETREKLVITSSDVGDAGAVLDGVLPAVVVSGSARVDPPQT